MKTKFDGFRLFRTLPAANLMTTEAKPYTAAYGDT